MRFDPHTPVHVAVWVAENDRARTNLGRAVADVARQTQALAARFDRGEVPLGSDFRRLTNTVFEASGYAAAVEALAATDPTRETP